MVYYREKQIDDAFFALSHPVRRAVLDKLSEHDSLSVADVSKPFALSPAQMTKHLAILERGGLLKRSKHGRSHFLQLHPEVLEEIMQWVQRYQKFWDMRLDALDQYLADANVDTDKRKK